MLHNSKLERLTSNKHYNLMGLLLSYEENEVLWIRLQGPYSQHLIFFLMYESTQ